jgi:acylglycerol lipase
MVQVLESERTSAKGHKLFTVTVLPDGPPAACLCWHHGVAEHIGRYKQVFQQFAEAGIAVFSGDIVGHGKSEGHRALIESYTDSVDEFLALCAHARQDVAERYPSAPVPFFIAGHSLGGLIAALACLRDQSAWSGLLLCSAALNVEMGLVLRIQAALGNVLAAVIPKARIVPAVDPKDMNPDAQCVQEYISDPLNTVGNLPVRTGNEVLKGMQALRKRWPDFTLPLYVHHGADDKCTSPAASEAFFAAASSQDKVMHMVPGGYHEVLFSPGVADNLTQEMVGWIKQRAAAGATGGGSGGAAAAAKM